ncbi:hypothetical protein J2750_002192 [Methanococcoides alaskense]|uniref:Uncharacterized protein n=2 Tax=Methanococcoides alaskense TaxID=325778 RepID=A0AA90ZA48_9EURY|nr:hypothetical protein [Methanococcoides alaskense]
MLHFELRRHFLLIFIILCLTALIYSNLPLDSDPMNISVQQENQTIEDILFDEISLALDGSEVRITGVNYYENINSIVIGFEKKWFYTNPDLKECMVDSVLTATSAIITHSEDLAGKKIVFTGSAIKRNGMGDQNMVKIFQTEIAFDDALYVDWEEFNGHGGEKELKNASFEYVWWHSDLSTGT